MKLDSSGYNLFWTNPDRFRIRVGWHLSPVEPSADSYAGLLSFGRRRGTALHELEDARYRGVSEFQAVEDLKNGGFGEREIKVAQVMAAAVRDHVGDEECLAVEAPFCVPIPGSPHFIVGRIDRIVRRDGEVFIRDYKTSKYRPKRELQHKGEEYCRGTQVGFYIAGARSLGFECNKFVYSLVHSERDNARASVLDFPTSRTSIEIQQLMRSVHLTCEIILWMKKTFGMEKSWPIVPERFTSGYEPLLGRSLYEDYVPEGFQQKPYHLNIAEIL